MSGRGPPRGLAQRTGGAGSTHALVGGGAARARAEALPRFSERVANYRLSSPPAMVVALPAITASIWRSTSSKASGLVT